MGEAIRLRGRARFGDLNVVEPDAELDELFAELLSGRNVVAFLDADYRRIQSAKNRALLYGLLAQVLLQGEASVWSTLSLRCPYSLSEITQFASEVEPKIYGPDERLREASQVLRGVARVVNFLQAGRPWDACDVVERIDCPAVRQVVAYGVLRFVHITDVPDREPERKGLEALLRSSDARDE